MDPLTAATITNLDLLAAFHRGVGRDLHDTAPEVVVWAVFLHKGNTVRATEYESTSAGLLLLTHDVFEHLSQGAEYGCAQFVGTEKPGVVQETQNALCEASVPSS